MLDKFKESMSKSPFGEEGEMTDEALYNKYRDTIDPLMMEGEQVLKVYGLMRDFACITTERFIFVDKQGVSGKKREIISVFLRHIQEVVVEQGFLTGTVKVFTTGRSYELLLYNKSATAKFAKELMENMR